VNVDGVETDRGERFFQIVDSDRLQFRTERLAAFPAYLELMRIMSGTILEAEIKPIYEKIRLNLNRRERVRLERMSRKFFYFGRGMKSYSGQQDVLDQVYSALVRENLLRISFDRDGVENQAIVRPLTLMMFNSGLYLVLQFEEQSSEDQVYHFRLESIQSAAVIKGSSFVYPAAYDPAKLHEGQFGIIRGKAEYTVELEFDGDVKLQRYVQERKWTDSDEYFAVDGKLHLRMKVSDLTEVRSWVLSFGCGCRVIGPKILKEQVMGALSGALALYSKV
jgi:predicted DNA-binding transcriptional regulator YafY